MERKSLAKIYCLILCFFFTPVALSDADVKEFKIYHSLGYKGIPDISDVYDIGYMKIFGHYHFWGKDQQVGVLPTKDRIDKVINEIVDQDYDLVCMDIEAWPLKINPGYDNKASIANYLYVASELKRKMPEIKFGYYGVLPIREYYAPLRSKGKDTAAMKRWMEANQELQVVENYVNVVMPSLYTFKKNMDDWHVYALKNIEEARKYNKPVIVFLWPEYHKKNGLDYFIDGEYWKFQLETVYKHADGVVIWGPKINNIKWDEQWPWWVETKKFIKRVNK